MTRKHYRFLAKWLARTNKDIEQYDFELLLSFLKEDNRKFCKKTFRDAYHAFIEMELANEELQR